MASAEMLMVFSYDVSNDKQRRRVAGLLEEHMVRVQQSVFEARLSRRATEKLISQVTAELEADDSLRVYAVSAHGLARSHAFGPLPLPEAEDFYLL